MSATHSASHSFDLIIVGAGLAGAALACVVAQANKELRIAMVEAQTLPAEPPSLAQAVQGFDPRVSALTLASQQLLQGIGVWPAIISQRAEAYSHMQVWDAEGTGSVSFEAAEVNQPCLGYIVENRITLSALLNTLKGLANVQCFNPAKVAALESEPQQRCLRLEDGQRLSAPLMVAADGANSLLRQQAGFAVREWDYQHRAIVATVQTELPHQHTAWQRFLPQGPLAFLPLAAAAEADSHFCSIVWSAVPEYAQQLMALDDQTFAQQLAAAFEHKLGAVQALSQRYSFPLQQRHAVDYIQPGLALVGDAAHSIHPLAGQGINLGFSDVAVLAEEILRASQRGLALADYSILQRYQRRRKADNLSMMLAMDGFKRLFAETNIALRWLRNTGMNSFNRSPAIKRKIMRSAMGLN
ncbi:UbiH/UbiF/VisC/COQ6 family ubiquinone biosynthesis hydroxylase [Dasania sp. GY-MA-18]|uniref:UbiH/UbiF/VisC/COQ6 family ubiquinone biosynthesis hydroxylase n=1 Tax=Dasania phycosphaerae TaxID=2950436 RepID=A0A9J6RKU4_9GAMM|nr:MULTISPECIES: UbiH/UbiF/VisC/COQ6 family ubiquinone biosynthesis hydroxylase [Dasania]MCR8922185.1 UbiH/UbiF/VisC/COQ6 family ubiquinone biosynthesis hydroxylase [Dasania sp. GY-MA-18]MCZ0864613.1 UbiH/UbiF/VisC/COQ6 family ubiquinone biosynthesis hydroxylase [Dasania phycosphaerae]MCZ0868341.1 UbiH/UbiF/VisC/COQ6 family ubiquinone biosynthesis hydroxylase [Dasania phycosphaerae]